MTRPNWNISNVLIPHREDAVIRHTLFPNRSMKRKKINDRAKTLPQGEYSRVPVYGFITEG